MTNYNNIYIPQKPKTSINEVFQIFDNLMSEIAILITVFSAIGAVLFWMIVFLVPVVDVV